MPPSEDLRDPTTISRWKFLADAGALLDSSLDYQSTLTNVLHLAVPAIADFAALALVSDDGSMTWGASIHRNDAMAEVAAHLREFQPAFNMPGHPAAGALRNLPQFFPSIDEALLRAMSRDDTHLGLLRQLSLISFITVPLSARDRVLGVLVFAVTTDSGRRYEEADLVLAQEVATRSALAVDHALLYREAKEAARAREVMMGVVSHDLKNPLSTISMATSFLLEDVVPAEESRAIERKQLGAIQRAAERMFRLIDDLLDITALEAGQLSLGRRRPQAVGPILDDALDMIAPLAAAKHIEIVRDPCGDLPTISVDRDRLLQVFSNLGGNAVKFTPEGGRVTLAVCDSVDAVEFIMSDTGPGIAAADLPRVFDLFWQARNTAHLGTGLGLAIAKGIVEAHGGQISVSSTVGEGTEFRFTIPRGAVDAAAAGA